MKVPVPADARCPVCAEGFTEPPRGCPRCQTPHHQDCWDYVPGCALFACAAPERMGHDEWPEVERLVLRRAAILDLGGQLILGGLVAAPITLILCGMHSLPFRGSLLVVAAGVLAAPVAGLLSLRLRSSAARRELLAFEEEGNPRLRGALESRVGRLGGMPPWELALCTALVLGAFMNLSVVRAGYAPRSTLGQVLGELRPFLWGSFLLVFPLATLAARMLGSPRILAHRLASAEARDAPKPKGAPE